jgi:hypothetical protein
MPRAQYASKLAMALASSRTLWRKLWAISGLAVFSFDVPVDRVSEKAPTK